MTLPHARFARGAALLVVAVSAGLSACDGIFVASQLDGAATIALSFSVASAAAGDAQAFDRVDEARIVLQRRSDGTVVYDQVVTLAATGGDREASVEVEITQDPESFDLAAQLSAAGQALFDGSSTVTVREGQVTSADVPLEPVVAAIDLSLSSITLTSIGESVPITASALYASGDTAYSASPQLSSQNPSVASVAGGMITARGEGTTQIEARAGLVTATAEVRVQAAVASIDVSPASVTLDVGEEIQLVAVAHDANGNVLNRTPQWSTSNGSVASVTGGGLVRGVAAGQAEIRASVGSVSGSATVSVMLDPVTSVIIFPTAARLAVGQTVQFNATMRTASGQTVNRAVQWTTSDPSVATVNTSGLATGRGAGTAVISATAEGVSGSAQVTVDPPVQAPIDLAAGLPVVTPSNANVSESISIQATVRNVGTAASGTFGWRLRVGATVVATGTASLAGGAGTTVSATGLGPYAQGTYTASLDVDYTDVVSESDENNNSASATFTVSSIPVELVAGPPVVTPSNPSTTDSVHISASITNTGSAASGTFSYRIRLGATTIAGGSRTLNAGATVNISSPVLSPLPAGTYTATLEVDYTNAVTEPDETNNVASTTFNVGAPVVSYVVVTPGSATIDIGETVQLTATAYTSNNIPIPGPLPVVWSSSNPTVATVSNSGLVTGVGAGTAAIGATVSGKSDSATINVTQSLPDLTISSGTPTVTPTSVRAGKTVQMSAWTVTNVGTAPSGSFSNGFYLSTNSTISPVDTYLGGNSNLSLAPGESFNWGGPSLGIPANTPPGNYYIGIYVDRASQVTESSELNNGVGTPITVLPAGPVIYGYGVTVVKLNDPTCANTGTRFSHSFQYSDSSGTVSTSQSIINAHYIFQPSNVSGSFSINPVTVTGPNTGTAAFETCTRFNGDTMISFTITLTDDQGAESNSEYVDISKPVGGNSPELVDVAPAQRVIPVRGGLKSFILQGGATR